MGLRIDPAELRRWEAAGLIQPTPTARPVVEWTEKAFQSEVLRLAKAGGWLTYHTHNSRRSEPGFPDLVLVRDRVIFAELKTDRGKVTPEQQLWLDRLRAAGATADVWRPRDLPAIAAVLAGA